MSIRATNGAAVKALREALGKNQGGLAAQAGISASYLANIEAGRKRPPLATARRLADVLGVPVDAITYPVTASWAADAAEEEWIPAHEEQAA
jgi:transcriptional regulator with XRE-family HTH domain